MHSCMDLFVLCIHGLSFEVCLLCDLNFRNCVLQDHQYVVQTEVLYNSWNLDESQLTFVRMLEGMKNETRGDYCT